VWGGDNKLYVIDYDLRDSSITLFESMAPEKGSNGPVVPFGLAKYLTLHGIEAFQAALETAKNPLYLDPCGGKGYMEMDKLELGKKLSAHKEMDVSIASVEDFCKAIESLGLCKGCGLHSGVTESLFENIRKYNNKQNAETVNEKND
jgi:hypothetical protein